MFQYVSPSATILIKREIFLSIVYSVIQSIIIMMMIILGHEKYTLQFMAKNKQQSHNLRMPAESCKKLFG